MFQISFSNFRKIKFHLGDAKLVFSFLFLDINFPINGSNDTDIYLKFLISLYSCFTFLDVS